jgi:hypothetical protein
LDRSANSEFVIDNLRLSTLPARPVNSNVRRLSQKMIMSIPLLVLTTFVQLTPGAQGNTDTPGVSINPSAPLDNPWLLLASVAMFAISFFLLHQAVAFQKWITAKDEAAPNPRAGVGLAWGLALAMVVFSTLYWLVGHPPPQPGVAGPEAFRWFMSNRPSELAIGPLLGSTIPSAIAIFKFITAGFIMRGAGKEVPPLSRSPVAALAGAIFTLISLSASIATLIMFYSWHP